MRILGIIVVLVIAIARGHSQSAATNNPAATDAPPLAIEPGSEKSWSVGLSIYGYIVHDSPDYVQPTLTLDRNWLHLEARYNYEALETGSTWVGYNFSGGNKLAWELTPMLGAVFGNVTGVAPGYSGSLSWWKLGLYSEGEYVFNTRDSSLSFFYNWSELTLAPFEWFRFGLVTQHTQAYQTDREIQRGFLVGFSYKIATFTTYVFNADEGKPTVVLALGLSF
jgi:hypothetical protein